jgi:hypothetical protein
MREVSFDDTGRSKIGIDRKLISPFPTSPLLVKMAPMIAPNPTRDAFQPRRAASPSPKLRKLFIHRRGEFYWCINKK